MAKIKRENIEVISTKLNSDLLLRLRTAVNRKGKHMWSALEEAIEMWLEKANKANK